MEIVRKVKIIDIFMYTGYRYCILWIAHSIRVHALLWVARVNIVIERDNQYLYIYYNGPKVRCYRFLKMLLSLLLVFSLPHTVNGYSRTVGIDGLESYGIFF